MINWDEIRGNHINTIEGIYLNSPANGLISSKTIAYDQQETVKFLSNPGKYRIDFIVNSIPRIKTLLGNQINASEYSVALIPNFSIGLNFFVSSISPSMKIGLIRNDYPSLTKPFEVRQHTISWLNFEDDLTLDLTKVEQLIIENNLDVFAISHCQWLTGYLADIESIGAICKQHNCLFMVDATQSFGAIEIDVTKCNIDVLGASCYKWPLAGFGNGFLYVAKDVLNKFPARVAGFNSFFWEKNEAIYRPSIKSFEPGHHDHDAFNRLEFSLQKINEIGIDNIHTKITELMDYLIEQLQKYNIEIIGDFLDENRLGIISIASRPNLFKHLISKNIEVSERGGNIRLGVHYYNNRTDIDSFIAATLSL